MRMWNGLVAVGMFFLFTALASANVATVLHLEGKAVIVDSKNHSRPAKVGSKIEAGERVETMKDATMILELSDGSRIKINSASALKLSSLTEQKEVRLLVGSVFVKVTKQTRLGRFRVSAKTVTMGVRGTEFFVAYSKKVGSKQNLWMCVNEGSVEVKSDSTHQKVLVKQGNGIVIKNSKELTDPKSYPWTKDLNWNMDAKRGTVKNVTKINWKKK